MAESESIYEIINQAAVQAAMVVMLVLRVTETGTWSATTPNQSDTVAEAWRTNTRKA